MNNIATSRILSNPIISGQKINLQTLEAKELPAYPEMQATFMPAKKIELDENIQKGLLLGLLGTGLIVAGTPALILGSTTKALESATGRALESVAGAFRLGGLMSLAGAAKKIKQSDQKVLRGSLLAAGGTASMLASAGLFGHIGGLTSIFLGIGGFISALSGVRTLLKN